MHKLSQATTLLSAVVLITACGGGGGGTSATLAGPSTSVLATFGDGSGVARVLATFGDGSGVAEIVNDGYVFVGMVPDVNSVGSGPTVATDLSGVTHSSSNAYGDFYTGTAVINGISVSTTAFVDTTANTAILYVFNSNTSVLVAGGEAVSSIPQGTFKYVGTNGLGRRDGTYSETGTFAMTVDFTNGSAALSGSTNTSTVAAIGISVNSSIGTFQSRDVEIRLGGGSPIIGSIYGNFHNAGATGVSGIYHDNAPNPSYAGAIAGHR